MSRNGRYGTTERRILPNSGSMGTIEVLTAHASPWAIYDASVERCVTTVLLRTTDLSAAIPSRGTRRILIQAFSVVQWGRSRTNAFPFDFHYLRKQALVHSCEVRVPHRLGYDFHLRLLNFKLCTLYPLSHQT